MELTGDITGYVDVAQVVLYVFWLFFFVLIFWLHREGKREGYPLESDTGLGGPREGFPLMASPKTFLRKDGSKVVPEKDRTEPAWHAKRMAPISGSPYLPEGNAMASASGPGSYANRADVPDATWHGKPVLVPLRNLPEYGVSDKDPDPRGMPVVGADGEAGGTVVDVWIDVSEAIIRYYEFELPGGGRRLVPVNFTRIPGLLDPLNFMNPTKGKHGPVKVGSILGEHFKEVPALANPDQVTKLEEDKIMAYYGGGYLYAEASRAEPYF
jgi:photosynthetic reaction center H subunit